MLAITAFIDEALLRLPAQSLILPSAMGVHWAAEDGEHEPDDEEAPETPPNEPRPTPVQDPPPEPKQKGPYVVQAGGSVTTERKERRGFASMSPEKQREIASKGGRAAHEKGTAHEWTADEARSAGRRGGQVSRGGRGRLMPSDTTSPATPQNETPSGERFPATRVE
jgi:general stress protein YciG